MKVKKILITQPPPAESEKNPYVDIASKYNVEVVFKKFFRVVPLNSLEFRQKNKCNLADFNALVFTSKNVIDYYFQLLRDLRLEIRDDTKYFCSSEKIAVYLQKYIPFRKRKIFWGNSSLNDLIPIFKKEENQQLLYLIPTSDSSYDFSTTLFKNHNLNYRKIIIYQNQYEDLTSFPIKDFQIMCLFSPHGVNSLFHSFPDYKQDDQIILVHGSATAEEARNKNLVVAEIIPNERFSSMILALENYLTTLNKKRKDK
ncbi:MAG: uroporphyrinogen-III synthase [Bacteroidales bacterium]|nr:uroporphyrinogen-III synthase [Bacteroidales bacterium]